MIVGILELPVLYSFPPFPSWFLVSTYSCRVALHTSGLKETEWLEKQRSTFFKEATNEFYA